MNKIHTTTQRPSSKQKHNEIIYPTWQVFGRTRIKKLRMTRSTTTITTTLNSFRSVTK